MFSLASIDISASLIWALICEVYLYHKSTFDSSYTTSMLSTWGNAYLSCVDKCVFEEDRCHLNRLWLIGPTHKLHDQRDQKLVLDSKLIRKCLIYTSSWLSNFLIWASLPFLVALSIINVSLKSAYLEIKLLLVILQILSSNPFVWIRLCAILKFKL
jgi:hypothetical protein